MIYWIVIENLKKYLYNTHNLKLHSLIVQFDGADFLYIYKFIYYCHKNQLLIIIVSKQVLVK